MLTHSPFFSVSSPTMMALRALVTTGKDVLGSCPSMPSAVMALRTIGCSGWLGASGCGAAATPLLDTVGMFGRR